MICQHCNKQEATTTAASSKKDPITGTVGRIPLNVCEGCKDDLRELTQEYRSYTAARVHRRGKKEAGV